MWYPRLAAAIVLPVLATPFVAPAAAAGRPDTVTRFAGTAGLAQLAADAGGGLVGADPAGDRVVRIAPGGAVTVVAGGPAAGLDRPEGVAVGGDGTVYVSDARHRVASITPGGRLRIVAGNGSAGAPVPGPALASPLAAPAGLAVDRAGNLYIADDGAVLRVTPAGALSELAAAPGARGVAVDSAGNVYVPGRGCTVERIAPAGARSTYAGTGCGRPTPGPAAASRLGPIEHLSVDGSDRLYLAGADAVAVVGPDGTLSVRGEGTGGRSAVASPAGVVFAGGAGGVARIGPATPSAPRDLRVTPRDGALELSFRAPLDPGDAPVTGYEVSLDGAQTWQPLATGTAGEERSGTVPRLDNGVQYAVLVSARNAGGASPGSAILPGVPGRALLPVSGSDIAGTAGAGLLAMLLGVCLVATAAVARRAMERDGTRL